MHILHDDLHVNLPSYTQQTPFRPSQAVAEAEEARHHPEEAAVAAEHQTLRSAAVDFLHTQLVHQRSGTHHAYSSA